MSNRAQASLLDIVQIAGQIQRYVAGVECTQLAVDDEKLASILYRIISVEEATKQSFSQPLRDQYPNISWREMAGIKNVVTHPDDPVALDVVWDVTQNKIPELLALLEPLLPLSSLTQDHSHFYTLTPNLSDELHSPQPISRPV
jgi:uncharacterized protein with HEPN domain